MALLNDPAAPRADSAAQGVQRRLGRQLWDISPPVHAGAPVFPGDAPFSAVWAARIGPGCPVNVSTLTLSPHTGAHADAPLHYDDAGASAGELDLLPYLGPCRVIHAMGCGPLVQWRHLEHALQNTLPNLPGAAPPNTAGVVPPNTAGVVPPNTAGVVPPRVLVRTYTHAPVDRWDPDLPAFAPDTIERLADLGVLLVGIDSASVDPASSKTLCSHQVLRRRGLRVLENLLLDDVPEGDYELIALPLKLMCVCASPVRAVLRALPSPL